MAKKKKGAAKKNLPPQKSARQRLEEREAFINEHGKKIAQVYEEAKNWGATAKKLNALSPRMIGYTLARLKLMECKDQNILRLLAADQEFAAPKRAKKFRAEG